MNPFLPLHQDAVLWKAQQLWLKASNPDAIIDANNSIAEMLLCIPETIKRDRYIKHIADFINSEIKNTHNELRNVEKELAALEKDLAKLEKKKRPTEDDSKQLESLPELIELKRQSCDATKSEIISEIDVKELHRTIKDELDRRERELKRKQIAAQTQKNNITLETLGLWNDFDGEVESAYEFGIAVYRGRYYSRGKQDDWIEISNFTMKIIYHVNTGNDVAYRLISIKNVDGTEKTLNINTDDFVSVGSFKKVLARQGHFVFKGTDNDLSRLHELLQKDEKPTDLITILGYHPRGRFYSWANGITDVSEDNTNTFHGIDDYGIVEFKDRNYFIPAMSKMYVDNDDQWQNEKRFVLIKNESVNFKIWSALHFKVYKDKAPIIQMWYISALFRDIIFNINHIRVTPILNFSGQRGAGKTQCAESLMSLFGHPQPAIPLGSHSTPKGFLRKFAQLRNAVVYLEEYKNNVKKDFIESLKNIYDGTSYTRAVKSTDFQTDSVPVNSACLLGGQEMPTIEPALYSRVIMLSFEPGKYTEQDRTAFKKLKTTELNGLSSITAEVLKHRQHFQKQFVKVFDEVKTEMFQSVANPNMDDRFIINISILYAIRKTLDGLLDFSFSLEEAKQFLIDNVRKQFAVMEGNDDLGKWWQIIEILAAQSILRAGRDYRFDGSTLWLRMNNAYGGYVKEMNLRRDPNYIAKPSLEEYLRNDASTYIKYDKVKINTKEIQSYWAWAFNYTELQNRYQIELSMPGAEDNNMSFYTPTNPSNIINEGNTPETMGW